MKAGEVILAGAVLFLLCASALFFAASVWYDAQENLAYYEAHSRTPWYVRWAERLLGREAR